MTLLEFIMRDRHEYYIRSAFSYAHAYVHPADWHHLQQEVHASLETMSRFGAGARPRFDIDGTTVDAEIYITPGWVIFWTTDQMPGRRVVQRQFRCLEHEDCRASIALGLECWASPRQGAEPEKGDGT